MKEGDVVYLHVSASSILLKHNVPYIIDIIGDIFVSLRNVRYSFHKTALLSEKDYNIMKRKDKLQKLLHE